MHWRRLHALHPASIKVPGMWEKSQDCLCERNTAHKKGTRKVG